MARANDASAAPEDDRTAHPPNRAMRVLEEDTVIDKPVDLVAYHHQVDIERKKRGFRSVESFVAFIYSRTRFKISVDSYYKWVRGDFKPREEFSYVFAINLALYGQLMPVALMEHCVDPIWMEIDADHGELPDRWRIENYVETVSSISFDTPERPTVEEVAERVNGNPSDYLDPFESEDAED